MKATSHAMDGFAERAETTLEFDRLVEFYRPRIFRFALASLRDRDAAETVAQDCFLRAHAAQQTFRGDCSVQTWLMGIAANLIRDYARNRKWQFWKRTRETALPETALNHGALCFAGDSPERQAVVKQQIEAIWNATEHLSERQRTVFLLRFVEDMNILEIAAATGISEGSVKTHLFRALQTLRLKIEGGK